MNSVNPKVLHFSLSSDSWEWALEELSTSEIERFQRLQGAKAKLWVQSRAYLKRILADEIQIQAKDVLITYTDMGKPYCPQWSGHFNLSHSQDQMVLALSPYPVGIDLEWMNPKRPFLSLAQRFLGEVEYAQLVQLSEIDQVPLFYQFWTQKEAVYKLIGGDFFAIAKHPWVYGINEYQGIQIHLNQDLRADGYALSIACLV